MEILKPTRSQIAINILVFAISMVATDKIPEISQQLFPGQPYVKGITYAAMGIVVLSLLLLIVAIYLHDKRDEFTAEKKALVEAQKRERIRQAIPAHITVTSREDVLRVHENGDGVLEWKFQIRVMDAEKCESLDLQIVSEFFDKITPHVDGSPVTSNVIVEEIRVGHNVVSQPQSFYTTHEVRFPHYSDPQKRPIEFGILRVPLSFDDFNTATENTIYVKLLMRGTFAAARNAEGDFFVVDIPQLTENFKVEIRAMNPEYVVQSVSSVQTKKLAVAMGYLGTEDPSEALHQKDKVKQSGDALIWQTIYPKLGYHYRMSFRLVKAGRTH